MKLIKILNNIDNLEIINGLDINEIEVNSIQYDSRKVQLNDFFVCVNGFDTNGHLFIDSAIKNGAKVIAISEDVDCDKYPDIIFIKNKDSRKFLAKAGANFYDNPATKLKMVGITGTKGKTTITYILKNIMAKSNVKVGIIGTTGIIYNGKKQGSNRTTPESLDLQGILADMHKSGVELVIMEVSSHALDLDRVYGINFEVAAFSNLSREHLGFHKTFANYFAAKAKLFDMAKKAVINIDDKYGEQLYNLKTIPKISIGIKKTADIQPQVVKTDIKGSIITINDLEFKTSLFGDFNIYNVLVAYGVSISLGIEVEAIAAGLLELSIPGRMEFVKNSKNYDVIVDYAHSTASLEQALVTIKKYTAKRLILVFGCGGGGIQDPLKRKLMGEVAAKYADYIIITEDNPRDEKAEDIAQAIAMGMHKSTKYQIIIDRAQAIQAAINSYQTGDIILIAGKGHEETQEYKDKIVRFSDVETVQECLQ